MTPKHRAKLIREHFQLSDVDAGIVGATLLIEAVDKMPHAAGRQVARIAIEGLDASLTLKQLSESLERKASA